MPTACYDECLLDDKYIREHYFFSGACCASKTSRWVPRPLEAFFLKGTLFFFWPIKTSFLVGAVYHSDAAAVVAKDTAGFGSHRRFCYILSSKRVSVSGASGLLLVSPLSAFCLFHSF